MNGLPQGRFRLYLQLPNGRRRPCSGWQKNLITYSWAEAAAQLFAAGDPAYKLGALYVEFQLVADPDDEVTPPDFDRSGGKAYYDSLALSADTDYLRIPVRFAAVASTDLDLFPLGNEVTISGITNGSVGVHGKEFSNTANAKVFGLAAVVTPDFVDDSRDLVVARSYLPADEQTVKSASLQFSADYALPFG